jgi:hypothetical protein
MAQKAAGKKKLRHTFKTLRKPNVVVGSGEVEQTTAVISAHLHTKHRLYKIAGGIAVAIIIVVLAVLGLNKQAHQRSINKAQDALVTQAAALLDPLYTLKLAPIVTQIAEQPDYASSADCLYVLTQYYVNIGDATNSQKYYDMLTNVYKPQKGYANADLKAVARTPDDLQATITFVKDQASQAQQNSNSISPRYTQ